MTNHIHPAERIAETRFSHPLAALTNTVETLRSDVSKARDADFDDRAIAEIAWLAGRAQAEAIAILASRFGVDSDAITDAIEDPGSHPDLAHRVNSLVPGLARCV